MDMHKVQDIQPRHLIKSAALPGLWQLMFINILMCSNDHKLGWKRRAWTHPKNAILFLKDDHPQWLAGSAQTWQLTKHSLDNIKTHIMMSVPFHGMIHIRGATPPLHNDQPFTSRQVPLQPDIAHNCICVLKLID